MIEAYLIGYVFAYFFSFAVLRGEAGLGTAIFAAPFVAIFYPLLIPVILWTYLDDKYPPSIKTKKLGEWG